MSTPTSSLSAEELAELTTSVHKVLARDWEKATAAGEADAHVRLGSTWAAAAELGLMGLAEDRALDAAAAAVVVTGRLAQPLPLMDAFVAHGLLVGRPDLQRGIELGTIRPLVTVAGQPGRRFAEAAPAATHLLEIASDQDSVALLPIVGVDLLPGLARPPWGDLSVDEAGASTLRCGPVSRLEAVALLRLGLAARALGAAELAGELAVEHANTRVAFGRPIGSFQAVSHRSANGAAVVTAARLLLGEAARAWIESRPDWNLSVELAVAFIADHALPTQLDAAHTLAATGFFDEHECPWLFRRINADLARLPLLAPVMGGVAELLVEGGAGLPKPRLGDQAEEFRAEVRALLAECGAGGVDHDEAVSRVLVAAGKRGYVTLAWPVEHGGRGASIEQEIVLAEEFKYARVPFLGKTAADLLGPTVIAFGTPEQQQRFLPLLASGDFPFYLGYSEPEVGSDLASLRARAARDGDDWVVDGQKSWGTKADIADWVWLAVRTDPDATRPHAGITVFLTRTDRPGFSLQRHRALSGDINCTTFFDGYRVPDADRIGEVHGGWRVITHALTKERVMMATASADVHRILDDLLAEVRADPRSLLGEVGSQHRALVAQHAARLQAARLLTYAAARAGGRGGTERAEASMAKVLATPLQEDFCAAAVQILGPRALIGAGHPDAVSDGAFDYHLRNSVKQVVGGGTIDIQRNLIVRSLGLPR